MSPKINVEIAEQLPEPIEGKIYSIVETEMVTTQVRGYKGLRVAMVAEDETRVNTVLWMREVAGERSKLGAFVSALGDDTDSWEGKTIRVVTWRPGDRKIEVIQ